MAAGKRDTHGNAVSLTCGGCDAGTRTYRSAPGSTGRLRRLPARASSVGSRRSAGPTADKIPARHQSEDRPGDRPDDPVRDPRSRRRGHRMNRRELILQLAGMMAAGPVRAQQKAVPVIGYLGNTSGPTAPNTAAFPQGLSETGYVEGQNV